MQRRGAPDARREVAVAHGDGERHVVRERRAVGAVGEREAEEVRFLDGDAGGEHDGVGYDEHGDERGDGDGGQRRDEVAAAFGAASSVGPGLYTCRQTQQQESPSPQLQSPSPQQQQQQSSMAQQPASMAQQSASMAWQSV